MEIVIPMTELFDRVLALLGKSETDEAFAQVCKDFDDVSKVDFEDGDHQILVLPKIGLHLHLSKNKAQFYSVFFHVKTAATICGEISPYSGTLPHGISTAETREEIQLRFGRAPFASEIVPASCDSGECVYDKWDYYLLTPTYLTLIFDAKSEQLRSFFVSTEP
jgi:hypothetical protein